MTKTVYTQNKAVISYIRKRHSSKMTTERICNGINNDYNLKLTPTQVSKCLNRFSEKNMVGRTNSATGKTSLGHKAVLWFYKPNKS